MSATVRDLLAAKNSAVVYTCSPDLPVAEAARMLRDRRVGCLVVARGGEVRGLLSERDVVVGVVAQGLDPGATTVDEVMSRQVATVALDAPCEEAEGLLRARRVHHLPVVGPRGLLGLVSLGDLARFHAQRRRAHQEMGQAAAP